MEFIRNTIGSILKIVFTNRWSLALLHYMRVNALAIFTTLVISILVITVFNKLISPYFHEHYKRLLFYDDALQHMKDVLEMDYDVLWNQPEFCLAFLKFHEAYQTFVAVARSDFSGKIMKVSRYNKYTVIDMH